MPRQGYPYADVAAALQVRPEQSPLDFAVYLVNETRRYYTEKEPRRRITQIAIKRDGIQPFLQALANVTTAVGDMADEAELAAVRDALEHAQYYTSTGSIDLKSFLLDIAAMHPRDAVRSETTAALEAWDAMIVAACIVEGTNGLAIYAPLPGEFCLDYVETVSRLSPALWPWVQFLAAYGIRNLNESSPKYEVFQDLRQIPPGVEVRYASARAEDPPRAPSIENAATRPSPA
jgi:hypothetical protein